MSGGDLLPHASASPARRGIHWSIWIAAYFVGLIVVHAFDGPIFRALLSPDEEALEGRSLYQVFRQLGYFPTWLIVGLAIGLELQRRRQGGIELPPLKRERQGPDSVVMLITCSAISGALAELMKLVIGRSRPDAFGSPVYRGWFAGFEDGSNLGLPSSHAAVAFGAAFALLHAYPGAGWVLVLGATGCGITRIMAGAHLPTDVYVAAGVAYAVSQGYERVRRGMRGLR
ncbi:MAG: phosphatase PAP2 family protein [Planctomycetota bacterium]|nr:phosphatase PAP2 family protein [Planctomycetota bacterium]